MIHTVRPQPTRTHPAAAPRRDTAEVARDVFSRGAEFHWQRSWRLPGMDEIVVTTPEKVAKVLDSGNDTKKEQLFVKPGDSQALLPLRSDQDLAELAFFEASGSTDALGHQELAPALARVAAQGWRFHAEREGERVEVGLYGAYNALTDPAHRLFDLEAVSAAGVKVRLRDPATAQAFAAFYTSDSPNRSWEDKNYRFYRADGRSSSAFEAGSEGHWIGDVRGPWLPLSDRTGEELPRFEKLLAATRSVEASRRSLPAYEAFLEAAPEARRERAAELAAQGSAQARLAVEGLGGAEGLLGSAQGLDGQVLQRLLVGYLTHPDRDPMPALVDELLAENKLSAAADLANRWLKSQSTPGAQFAAETGALSHASSSLALYQAVQSHPGNPLEVARSCVTTLRASDNKKKDADIAQVGKTLLGALPADAFPVAGLATTALLDGGRWRLSDVRSRAAVAELALENLQGDPREFLRDAITSLRTLGNSEDAYRVGAALSDQLTPERKAWVEGIMQSKLRPSTTDTRAALYQAAAASPATSTRQLWSEVVTATKSDEDAARLGLLSLREMLWEPSTSQAATLAVRATRSAPDRWGLGKHASLRAVYEATLAAPESASGPELARLALTALDRAGKPEDAARIGVTYLEALQWKPGTQDVAGLALRLTAVEGSARLSRTDSQVAVYRAALKNCYLSGAHGVVCLGLEALAQIGNQTDRSRVAGAMLEELRGRASDPESRAALEQTAARMEELKRDPKAQADLVASTLELMRLTGLEQAVGEVVQGEDWVDISGHQVPVSKPESA